MINPLLLEKAKAKDTDEKYRAWVRRWPSCLTGSYSEFVHGEGRCEYAHVRAVEFGAGVSIKPEYSGVPLTNTEHSTTHQKGSDIFWPRERWKQEATKYLTMWINGIQPPKTEEHKANWKKEYIIEYPGHIIALYFLLVKYFKKDGAPPVKLTLQRHIQRRSLAQNNANWGVLIQSAIDFYISNPDALAGDMIKSIKFGLDDVSIHALFKRLFNDGKSTAKMDKIAFTKYTDDVYEYFQHHHGVELQRPVNQDEFYVNR